MSIPSGEIVFAGSWSSATTYRQNDGVISPIDSLFYVYIGTQPITGGSDPSVQPSVTWINIPPSATGDITGIVAGTGLSGGGSIGQITLDNTGVLGVVAGTGIGSSGGQTPTISNNGVLSVDGLGGSLITECGQFYTNTTQTISLVGSPATTVLSFNMDSYSGSAITRVGGTSATQFLVNTKGVYSLSTLVQMDAIASGDLSDPTVRLAFFIQRGANNVPILATVFEVPNPVPANPPLTLSGSFLLDVGDIVTLSIIYYLAAGRTFTILGASAPPLDFDLNTFWSYNLIKPLP